MFDIGFPELILVSVVALLVMGPERLPEALRTLGLWLGRARRSFMTVKTEIEKEIGMDEVRRQLHNEAVMDEMKRIEQDIKGSLTQEQEDVLFKQEPAQDPVQKPEQKLPSEAPEATGEDNRIQPTP